MSRQYLNDKWCVRCGRHTPTPYLRKHWRKLVHNPHPHGAGFDYPDLGVVDIGCGNGRNVNYLRDRGFCNTVAFDMVGDMGYPITLGRDRLPLLDHTANIILANYVFMFLNQKERRQLVDEIRRIAAPRCRIMVELYAAKDSFAKNEETMLNMQLKIAHRIGWNSMLYSKGRFVARNES